MSQDVFVHKLLLENGVKALDLTATSAQIHQLLQYAEGLLKWNKTYNLTAIRTPKEVITHHLLDSLSVAPFLTGDRVIDVGSGGGLPGIPLAIMNPLKKFTLLDSQNKKTRFMQQISYELGLGNVTVVHARAEDFIPEEKFDIVVTRAFASLKEMLRVTAHLVRDRAKFLAMKGPGVTKELEEITQGDTITAIHRLKVPGLDANRQLVVVEMGG